MVTFRTGDPFAATPAWVSSLPPPAPAVAARRGPHGRRRSASDCGARRERECGAGRREEEAVPARASIGVGGEGGGGGERRRAAEGGRREFGEAAGKRGKGFAFEIFGGQVGKKRRRV